MQIRVRVTPNAKKELITKEPDKLKVYLTVPPIEGKANKVLIRILADYYKVSKSQVEIIRGLKSRDKIIRIKNERDKNVAGTNQ